MSRPALIALLLILVAAAPATAFRTGTLQPVAGNPANRLLDVPIEASTYDEATHCTPNAKRPGVDDLEAWLTHRGQGVFWGDYRCEKWGHRQASLHAERRAIDWNLDARKPADRRAGTKLIDLLLAPDADGNPQALARRMGVEELIWDCSYWSAGQPDFGPYSACYDKKGLRLRPVDATAGHLNHIHIGLTRAGAAGRTSFWSR